jgi:hypothetical protein
MSLLFPEAASPRMITLILFAMNLWDARAQKKNPCSIMTKNSQILYKRFDDLSLIY